MACDSVGGCSGAFIINGRKIVGMGINKISVPDKNSSFLSYTEVLPV